MREGLHKYNTFITGVTKKRDTSDVFDLDGDTLSMYRNSKLKGLRLSGKKRKKGKNKKVVKKLHLFFGVGGGGY